MLVVIPEIQIRSVLSGTKFLYIKKACFHIEVFKSNRMLTDVLVAGAKLSLGKTRL